MRGNKLYIILFLQFLITVLAYQGSIPPFQKFIKFFEEDIYVNVTAKTNISTVMMILNANQCNMFNVNDKNMTIMVDNNMAVCYDVTECELISFDEYISCFVVDNNNNSTAELTYSILMGNQDYVGPYFIFSVLLIIFVMACVITGCCKSEFYGRRSIYRPNNSANYIRCPKCSCPKITCSNPCKIYREWKANREKEKLLDRTNRDFDYQYNDNL